jgi:gamma-glutamyltranspeptidase / glutathione hydrolase
LSSREDQLASLGRDSAGISKDTTHISVVDKQGNLFDAAPSGDKARSFL